MMTKIKLLILTFLLPVMAIAAPADSISAQAADDTYKVSLLTCRAGANIYELEGHSALRFVKPSTGEDIVVNWGLFDFDAPNFVYRFVKGETDYSVGVAPTGYFLRAYDRQGRSVVEQDLNLTPEQIAELQRLVSENLLPENRVYRYNYVLDNCSTRPLRIVEKAMGDTLSFNGTDLRRSNQHSVMRCAVSMPHTLGISSALTSPSAMALTAQ